jgi:hypothetical protein
MRQLTDNLKTTSQTILLIPVIGDLALESYQQLVRSTAARSDMANAWRGRTGTPLSRMGVSRNGERDPCCRSADDAYIVREAIIQVTRAWWDTGRSYDVQLLGW